MTATDLLEGRVAIVTGGARGIGAAISEMLVESGASVVIADSGTTIEGRDKDPSVAQQHANRLGERARHYTEDLAIPAAAAQLVDFTMDEFAAFCAQFSIGHHVQDQPGETLRVRPTSDGDDAEPSIAMGRIISKELEILGSLGMQFHRYPEMLAMIESGKLAPQKLIGRTITLEESAALLPEMNSFGETGIAVIDRF